MSYHWFKAESVDKLKSALEAAGPGAELEVHQEGEKMTFKVMHPASVVAEVNDSFLCPPICP